MLVFNYLLCSIFSIYCFVIIWLIFGNKKSSNKLNKELHSVSIIIAIRNGEKTLPSLIQDLSLQDYSGEFEIILVDDDSNDGTKDIIQNVIQKDDHFKYQSSQEGDSSLNFKKRALDAGIKIAKNEWMLFTDADCRLPVSWLSGMVRYFHSNTDYVIGHSYVKKNSGFINIFESIDFFLLLVSAFGSANQGYPLACTGQNQAYRKSLFAKVGGFSRINYHLQGDDSLFMNICKKICKSKIVFASNKECHVSVRGEKKWLNLLNQRLRWSGDANIMWKINIYFYLILCGFLFLHIKLIFLFLCAIFFNEYLLLLSQYLLIKFVFELGLYHIGCKYLNNTMNLFDFTIWYFIHIPYVVLIGLGSFFHKNLYWKGRKYNF